MSSRLRASIERNDEGFTLIELLVVIIIIGILAAIAIPVFLNQRKKGYEASMKSDLRTVAAEEETYYVDKQLYVAPSASSSKATSEYGTAYANPIAGKPASAIIGTDPVALSSGNWLLRGSTGSQFGANGYCLVMKSTKSTTVTWVYNSLSGGLQPSSVKKCVRPIAYSAW